MGFKIIYSSMDADWSNAELRGLFDQEENSLKGTMEMPNSKLVREFVFKRDPDFVRFYPTPSVINARTRWEFAVTSTLDHVRRHAWSSQRMLRKLKDGKRFMKLTLRTRIMEWISIEMKRKNSLLSSLVSMRRTPSSTPP